MEDKVILTQLYPLIIKKYQTNKAKVEKCLQKFINDRHDQIFDIAPYYRIYFRQEDLDLFFDSIGVTQQEVNSIISKTYYYEIPKFNPRAAKDEFTCCLMCLIRYFQINKKIRDLENYSLYLSFSGKFYPSIHSGSFPTVEPSQYKHIMDYVINNELSGRFDLKKYGTMIGTIKSINNTWYNSYIKRIKEFEDDDVVYLIQQLHDRIKSFMINIATLYYDAYTRRDYISFDSDSLDEDDYRIADNDSFRIERCVENTMNMLNSSSVNYVRCKNASDKNVRVDELQEILNSVFSDNRNIPDIRILVRNMIAVYFRDYKSKDVRDLKFLTTSIVPKPNTKDKYELEKMKLVKKILLNNSVHYRRRSANRKATESSYHKSILKYLAFTVQEANK